jgi:hypothetical protein
MRLFMIATTEKSRPAYHNAPGLASRSHATPEQPGRAPGKQPAASSPGEGVAWAPAWRFNNRAAPPPGSGDDDVAADQFLLLQQYGNMELTSPARRRFKIFVVGKLRLKAPRAFPGTGAGRTLGRDGKTIFRQNHEELSMNRAWARGLGSGDEPGSLQETPLGYAHPSPRPSPR